MFDLFMALHLSQLRYCTTEAMIHDESHMIRIDWSRLMDLITDVSSHGMKRPRKGGMSLEFMRVCFMMFARSVIPCQED